VYLSYLLVPIHVMLSAIDSEMDRCLAELMVLNAGNKRDFNVMVGLDDDNFMSRLNTVSTLLGLLSEKVSLSNLRAKAMVLSIHFIIHEANESIKQCDIYDENGWREAVQTIEQASTKINGLVISDITGSEDEVQKISQAINNALKERHETLDKSAATPQQRNSELENVLWGIGYSLRAFVDADSHYYKFLNQGATNTEPEALMLEIIQTLRPRQGW
jgi:hypothetical protein